MRRILTIEYELPGFSESYEKYNSKKSLLDSDIVIFRPHINFHLCEHYREKRICDKVYLENFREAVKHWNSEIREYLKAGRVLFVILDKLDQFYIRTSPSRYSENDMSRRTTDILIGGSNYDLLSKSKIIMNSVGDGILCKNKVFGEFFNNFKSRLSYRVYLKSESIEPGFTTKYGDKVIGGIENIGNGKIVYLPMLNFKVKDFIGKNEDDKLDLNKEEIKCSEIFIKNLVSIEKLILCKETKSIQPNWLENEEFELINVQKNKSIIDRLNQQINDLIKKSDLLKNEIKKENELKDLLFETGKPLENAVIKGLTILGYEAENYNDGELELDQIIISPEKNRFIGECEGKDNKAIEINKLRQLADLINEDFDKNDVPQEAYGLLIGNPQRVLIPSARTLSFTNKCKSAANRRNIGLILTSDLFRVCKYIIDKKDSNFKRECRDAIKNGLGGIIKFPKIPEKQ